MIRYLLDENVDPIYRRELVRREPAMVVWRVGSPGAPYQETLDPEILCWCEDNGFILVTNNRKSMPRHLRQHLSQGRHVPGILQLNPSMSIGETIDELFLIWAVSEDNEYSDRVFFLPISQ